MATHDISSSNLQDYQQEYFPRNGTPPVENSLQPRLQPQQNLHPGRFKEDWDASQRGSSILDGYSGGGITMRRSQSINSYRPGDDQQVTNLPQRSNTLKKKGSIRRTGSLSRHGSRRSMKAGSVRSLALNSSTAPDEAHSAFYCPVPTSGNPTEVLINRFQSWRKILKDLISYFREIQSHYEHKSKTLTKLSNVSNNISTPPSFLRTAGIDDALQLLRTYNKNAIYEANKAKEIEEDVILALTGLRSDLQQKIKEIKNLSGDFKNSVQKEMDNTRKTVRALHDVLGKNEADDSSTVGKQDPFLMRLAVDRQVERQLDEENYLHQAYLNLENSGRELESIVVGEIQKAYNAYTGILKREADNAYAIVDELRQGPISMPKDQEWIHFVTHDDQFVDPTIPLRSASHIHYPGQDHVAAQEIRAGLLERKSKYLKSYTAGWYVLSTTHLHEFKSADKGPAPVMSLYLPEQKLGSHSTGEGSSNKFILKGRQTGAMHRGHTWVFRAESHDTMMAWYEDIKALTEKTTEERNQFVRHHSRSLSQSSRRSASSDGIVDEDDEEPFSAGSQIEVNPNRSQDPATRRTQPGGRFPSDLQVNAQRGLQATHSPSSLSSNTQESDPRINFASGAIVNSGMADGNHENGHWQADYGRIDQTTNGDQSNAFMAHNEARRDGVNPYTNEPVEATTRQSYQPFVAPIIVSRSDGPHGNQEIPLGSSDERDLVDGCHQLSDKPNGVDVDGFAYEEQPMNGCAIGMGNLYGSAAYGADQKAGKQRHDSAEGIQLQKMTGDKNESRPTVNNIRKDSMNTISNLDMPGRYPTK